MITPRFKIEQTDSDLIFTIHAPYASLADAEIYADLDTFCFYASPYYLRLHLPGDVEETDASTGSYDADSGKFQLCVQKVKMGEHFRNLDLITALLTPRNLKKPDVTGPKIEVVGGDDDDNENSDDDEWLIDQCPFEEPTEDFLIVAPKYGFANQVCAVFSNFNSEFADVIEVPNPDKTSASERFRMRVEQECAAFNEDHYLADWAQSEDIEPLLHFQTSWQDKHEAKFTDKEVDILKDLPKKEFLMDTKEEHLALFSLVDILFAFSYNFRTTLGENTVESAWTINKLSATLSWLQSFPSLKDAVIAPVRRSLCFPLYRQWYLSIKVLDDVIDILNAGKIQILKCLLEIYMLFSFSEPRYILNQLYIRDYCVWVQQAPDSRIRALSTALNKIHLSKSDVGFDLDGLEHAAMIVQEEESSSKSHHIIPETKKKYSSEDQLVQSIVQMNLHDTSDESSNTSDTSDEDSDSSSSTELDSDDLTDDER